MQDLTTETWLIAYPTGDIALTNLGGMRYRLPAGRITIADIISTMPFDNVIVDVKLTGKQVTQTLLAGTSSLAIGGLRRVDGAWIVTKTGEELDPQKTYSVLVNDFMYAGGDNFGMLASFDPNAYNTSIDWRQPVIDWILAQGSSPDNPLDPAIEALGK